MKYSILFVFFMMMACSDNDDDCKNHFLVTESSEKEARLKCEGRANNHPKFDVISRVLIGCLNKKELEASKKSVSSTTQNACSGVTFTVRTRIE